ncbi:MAG: adenylate/guanylate cyclase domain-containing protein [Mesorhizobium sp.]|uniref:adenylate/guanylate cyclase domain-containing protein n=2 Tax=Mesorhizobium TaxID=68287 RepID=UPI000F75F656|nr:MULTISPECIES: adenylate/guanylate cyclase domain-containing protein [unclassified Mesorhizobium]RUX98817.1 adenylate/guanylate cyclase domain-containing protein [Mesorhizobium sp. M2A.F.Ca.ET.040.01.1.1]RVC71132.1 adenylate/guanylate cyclase domain-containing protein [Mesorhizobium sp. M00.F.Ca.ET.038.03.1.1]RVC80452.1 adenylate/guanylate cyclase domain-containing protein [Mesorhizobium sp. M2A.F.Ca.ET.046.02.1.1]AZO36872.1 adenylate/guanylate cyclase domain-containing protein [Mesorhizobium
MNEAQDLFSLLRQTADVDPPAVDAIKRAIAEGEDRELCRINVLAFASKHGLDEERAIGAFLHAARVGIFDISWNVLCPGCGGVLDTNATLKTLQKDEYTCALCSQGYSPTLDEMVEVTFTVSPRTRRIAAHNPHELPAVEYFRQIYWASGVDVPEEGFAQKMEEFSLEDIELAPGEKAVLPIQLPSEFIIVFEPVTHSAQFIDVKGEPTKERRSLSLVFDRDHVQSQTLEMQPGPLRISLENRTDTRVLPAVFIAGHELHEFLGKRRPFLTAKRLLTNQTFRDLYRTDTLAVDQRLKITSLTFLFTDLRGSTALYERVGDLSAFDLVREHFQVLQDIVAAEAGAVVKTIGDAVMATFATPDRAIAAALRMRDAMRALNDKSGREDLLLKIGVHAGPCIAVSLNERQDYFGQTVNIASRVQNLANAQAIFATRAVVDDNLTADLLRRKALKPEPHEVSLRGIEREVAVYMIP